MTKQTQICGACGLALCYLEIAPCGSNARLKSVDVNQFTVPTRQVTPLDGPSRLRAKGCKGSPGGTVKSAKALLTP